MACGNVILKVFVHNRSVGYFFYTFDPSLGSFLYCHQVHCQLPQRELWTPIHRSHEIDTAKWQYINIGKHLTEISRVTKLCRRPDDLLTQPTLPSTILEGCLGLFLVFSVGPLASGMYSGESLIGAVASKQLWFQSKLSQVHYIQLKFGCSASFTLYSTMLPGLPQC